jgi:hypothetical protein
MRSSEQFAFALFCAWIRYEEGTNTDEIEWEDIGEWQQKGYLDQVKTAFEWLFEHGRISAYINAEQLEAYRKEYRAYLTEKNEVKR